MRITRVPPEPQENRYSIEISETERRGLIHELGALRDTSLLGFPLLSENLFTALVDDVPWVHGAK